MTEAQTLRLDKISLSNFRCFKQCEVEFHKRLTLLIADNGRGKSAILDAITLALVPLVEQITGQDFEPEIRESDVHACPATDDSTSYLMQHALPTRIELSASLNGNSLAWSLDRRGVTRGYRTNVQVEGLKSAADNFLQSAKDNEVSVLPVIAQYSTERTSKQQEEVFPDLLDKEFEERLLGYSSFYKPIAGREAFFRWYEQQMDEISGPSSLSPSSYQSVQLIAAVNKAVSCVLRPSGWKSLAWGRFEPEPPENEGEGTDEDAPTKKGESILLAQHKTDGVFPVSFTSDGVRNMLTIVGDLAYRCARLNPHLGEAAAKETPGVVLIDEVDLHLHPGWQQKVIGLLQEAFPLVQFIATTHSPQVLSTADKSSIRVIHIEKGVGTTPAPKFQTKGIESADVLAEVMGIDPVPKVDEAVWLQEYRNLIAHNKLSSAEAKELKQKLEDHFGVEHPAMKELERLARFQEFKSRKKD